MAAATSGSRDKRVGGRASDSERASDRDRDLDLDLDLDRLLARARAHVRAGRFARALADVERVPAASKSTSWFLVEGDALRGLGKAAEAATAFETVARMTSEGTRAEAAYSAAYLRFHQLRDGAQALVVLDVHGVDARGSALEERGLGLRVQILAALGRHGEAARYAKGYLARFPRGGLRAFMAAMVRRGSGSGSPSAR